LVPHKQGNETRKHEDQGHQDQNKSALALSPWRLGDRGRDRCFKIRFHRNPESNRTKQPSHSPLMLALGLSHPPKERATPRFTNIVGASSSYTNPCNASLPPDWHVGLNRQTPGAKLPIRFAHAWASISRNGGRSSLRSGKAAAAKPAGAI
jgi:hypothetical protein